MVKTTGGNWPIPKGNINPGMTNAESSEPGAWEEVREFQVSIKNTRDVPIKVEIQRNFNTPYWQVKNTKEAGKYEKIDTDTIKYTVELKGKESKDWVYTLRTYHGTRE